MHPPVNESYALRFQLGDKIIVFSGTSCGKNGLSFYRKRTFPKVAGVLSYNLLINVKSVICVGIVHSCQRKPCIALFRAWSIDPRMHVNFMWIKRLWHDSLSPSLFIFAITNRKVLRGIWALFFRSSDIENARSDSPICDIRPQKFGNYILIKYTNGDKTKITKDSVWGFRRRKGRLYRMYKGEPYQVIVKDGYITTTTTRLPLANQC